MGGFKASFLLPLLALAGFQPADDVMSQDVSNLKSDERIVFFTTDATLSADQSHWNVPIHVWVFELDNATIRRATVSAALRAKYGLRTSAATQIFFDHRIRLLVADNERGKKIVINIAGKQFTLPKTEPNGHASTEIKLDADLVAQHAKDGQLTFSAAFRSIDDRSFVGTVNLISPTGISVISDIDDTVKMTHVTDRAKMLDHSLYRAFETVPGMADRYSLWQQQGVTFHFVSSSPWHFYEPLDAFMDDHGFPARTMSLKHFRFKDATLLNLFKSGLETKPAQIKPIMAAYPQRTFVLIGDSGEQDPEVYAGILKQFPERIERIYIRNVTDAKRSDERFQKAFAEIDDAKWTLFDDPDDLVWPK